ncbi:MAG: GH99 [uncultured Chloroflexi bacterium]|uniref:GH99 n=1 Tax=uncultured Chloroflexota bacterium TaxID=166587 RepID=A0A6J4JU75_9CHLR|nr:MAG: GH99 [uncultured Chloroflexota bacterium]
MHVLLLHMVTFSSFSFRAFLNTLRAGALALTLATLPLGAAPVVRADAPASQPAAGPSYVPYNEAHPVLAYYYAWWEASRLQAGIHHSSLGLGQNALPWEQVIDRPDVMREHMRLAQVAGVDGFIVNRAIDLGRLLELGAPYDFRTTVQVNAAGGPMSAVGELSQFMQHADHPAMVRYQGKPVVFFWRATDSPQWLALRNQIDPNRRTVWLADGDNFNILRNDAFDGISPYQIAWSQTPQTQLPGWGAKAIAANPHKLYVPPVAPGCNDSPARAATCIQDRRDGSYYRQTLQGALASNPQWAVVISTWNEWLEDTQIEPSVEYGDLYLHLTREFADQFKGGVAGALACC